MCILYVSKYIQSIIDKNLLGIHYHYFTVWQNWIVNLHACFLSVKGIRYVKWLSRLFLFESNHNFNHNFLLLIIIIKVSLKLLGSSLLLPSNFIYCLFLLVTKFFAPFCEKLCHTILPQVSPSLFYSWVNREKLCMKSS